MGDAVSDEGSESGRTHDEHPVTRRSVSETVNDADARQYCKNCDEPPRKTSESDTHALRLLELSNAYISSRAVQLFAELGLADIIHSNSSSRSASVEQICAQLIHVPPLKPCSLRRLLHFLTALGVLRFHEPNSHFALTPMGNLLRSDVPNSQYSSLRVAYQHFPIFSHMINALAQHEQPSEISKSGALRQIENNDQEQDIVREDQRGSSFFADLEARPELGTLFDDAMAAHLQRETNAMLRSAYDFRGVRSIVDVGGGNGSLLLAILAKHHSIQSGVVLDLPSVARRTQARLDQMVSEGRALGAFDTGSEQDTHVENDSRAMDEGLKQKYLAAARCSALPADFFECFADKLPQRPDTIVLRKVLHDWTEIDARRIVQRCAEALRDAENEKSPRLLRLPNEAYRRDQIESSKLHGKGKEEERSDVQSKHMNELKEHAARLLIVEIVISETGASVQSWRSDMGMMMLVGGMERSLHQFSELLSSANMFVSNVVQTDASTAIVEARLCEHEQLFARYKM